MSIKLQEHLGAKDETQHGPVPEKALATKKSMGGGGVFGHQLVRTLLHATGRKARGHSLVPTTPAPAIGDKIYNGPACADCKVQNPTRNDRRGLRSFKRNDVKVGEMRLRQEVRTPKFARVICRLQTMFWPRGIGPRQH